MLSASIQSREFCGNQRNFALFCGPKKNRKDDQNLQVSDKFKKISLSVEKVYPLILKINFVSLQPSISQDFYCNFMS